MRERESDKREKEKVMRQGERGKIDERGRERGDRERVRE